MILALAVFISDALIGILSGKYLDARQGKQKRAALGYAAMLDVAIGVNAMGFVEMKWVMLIPSVLGGLLGTYLSMRR
jgi:hypothetical protein